LPAFALTVLVAGCGKDDQKGTTGGTAGGTTAGGTGSDGGSDKGVTVLEPKGGILKGRIPLKGTPNIDKYNENLKTEMAKKDTDYCMKGSESEKTEQVYRVGPNGSLQWPAAGAKHVLKEDIIPDEADARRAESDGLRMFAARSAAGGAVGRPHVARALVERGFVQSVAEAFDRLIGTGKPAYVEKERFAIPEAVSLIHAAGGLTSIAHPTLYPNHERIVPELLDAGIDGVEVGLNVSVVTFSPLLDIAVPTVIAGVRP